MYRFTIFKDYQGIVGIQSLQVLYLFIISEIFCESPNFKKLVVLIMQFLKIRSHINYLLQSALQYH